MHSPDLIYCVNGNDGDYLHVCDEWKIDFTKQEKIKWLDENLEWCCGKRPYVRNDYEDFKASCSVCCKEQKGNNIYTLRDKWNKSKT